MKTKLHLLVYGLAFCLCCQVAFAQRNVSTKRGIAYGYHSPADMQAVSAGVSWWYNWSLKPDATVGEAYKTAGVEFVPMVWGGVPNVDQVSANIPEGTKYLLAFNEPNFGVQSNITAQRAAELWPVFEQVAARKNLKLVSPAVNYCGGNCNQTDPLVYLEEFFAACPDCKVDYIALHWYACTPDALIWYLNRFKKFGKPIWLTEFSCGDQSDLSLAVQKKYMQEAVSILENDTSVFRYAWFAGRTTEIPNVNLLGASGQLTELGQLYVSLPIGTPNQPIALPGKIEAELYTAMSGISTQGTTDTGGGLNVGWTDNGDWTEYKVNVTTAAPYDFTLRVAAASGGGSFHLELDGQRISPTTSVSSTNGWQNWVDLKVSNVSLPAGNHTLRLVFDTGGFNINYLVAQTAVIPPPVAGFNLSLANLCTGANTLVSNSSAGNISTYAWNFGSGATPATGTGSGPFTVSYNSAGSKTISLTVTGAGGSSIATKNVVVTSCVNTNLALLKPAFASSQESGGTVPAYATDGKTTTRWSSAFSDPQWIYVDLQTSSTLSKIILRWEAASGKAYAVESSNDLASWTPLYSTTTGDGGVDEFNVNGAGRYVRVRGTQRNTPYGYSLWELEVFGTSNARESETSADEMNTTSVSLYPNPFSSSLTLQASEEQVYKIEVYNSAGSLVSMINNPDLSSQRLQFGADLPDGLYLIKLFGQQGVNVVRVMKTR